jgi:hypothetical protein
MSDDIRDLVQSVDPMHARAPVEPVTAKSSRDRLEHIMRTSIDQRPSVRRHRGGPVRAAAVLAGALVLVVGFWLFTRADAPAPLELALPGSGPTASCLPVSPGTLADLPVAFEGTVRSIEGATVVLGVDTWYRGGDAERVALQAITDMDITVNPIDFQIGGRYLITATGGRVNYCGYSAPATPALRAMFEEAFGG